MVSPSDRHRRRRDHARRANRGPRSEAPCREASVNDRHDSVLPARLNHYASIITASLAVIDCGTVDFPTGLARDEPGIGTARHGASQHGTAWHGTY